jgi:ABC-type glycerol-3-phosphate transport system permease component
MGEEGETRSDRGDGAAVRPHQAAPAESFGWRGWILVGTILVAFLVIPAAILVLPEAQGVLGTLGLGMRDAYLVLPLPAAVVLGAVAVWSALSARRD